MHTCNACVAQLLRAYSVSLAEFLKLVVAALTGELTFVIVWTTDIKRLQVNFAVFHWTLILLFPSASASLVFKYFSQCWLESEECSSSFNCYP